MGDGEERGDARELSHPPLSDIIITLYCELLHYLPSVPDYEWGCCMRALSLHSARCHGLKQGSPFMHSVSDFLSLDSGHRGCLIAVCVSMHTCVSACFYRGCDLIALLAGFSSVHQGLASICIRGVLSLCGRLDHSLQIQSKMFPPPGQW